MNLQQDWVRVIRASSGDVRRMASVLRFNSIPTVGQENSAEHSFWVALYATMIHFECDGAPELLGPLLVHALTHDIADACGAEIVRTFKYSTPELKREVDRAEEIITGQLPDAVSALRGFHNHYGSKSKYIEVVVKAADFLSLFQFMRREIMRSNNEILPFYERMIHDLSDMITNGPADTPGGFGAKAFYASLHAEAQNVATICLGDDALSFLHPDNIMSLGCTIT